MNYYYKLEFNKARGHVMERQNYIRNIHEMYNKRSNLRNRYDQCTEDTEIGEDDVRVDSDDFRASNKMLHMIGDQAHYPHYELPAKHSKYTNKSRKTNNQQQMPYGMQNYPYQQPWAYNTVPHNNNIGDHQPSNNYVYVGQNDNNFSQDTSPGHRLGLQHNHYNNHNDNNSFNHYETPRQHSHQYHRQYFSQHPPSHQQLSKPESAPERNQLLKKSTTKNNGSTMNRSSKRWK